LGGSARGKRERSGSAWAQRHSSWMTGASSFHSPPQGDVSGLPKPRTIAFQGNLTQGPWSGGVERGICSDRIGHGSTRLQTKITKLLGATASREDGKSCSRGGARRSPNEPQKYHVSRGGRSSAIPQVSLEKFPLLWGGSEQETSYVSLASAKNVTGGSLRSSEIMSYGKRRLLG